MNSLYSLFFNNLGLSQWIFPLSLHNEGADGIIDVESLRFDLETIRLATNNFSEANEVGKGGFGAVYKVTILQTFERNIPVTY